MSDSKGKVIGIGGIFFLADNPQDLKKWYTDHLGFSPDEYGQMFKARDWDDPEKHALLQWSIFNSNTEYLNPSKKPYMINYRVDDLQAIVAKLKEKGTELLEDIQEYEYGKFAHLMDPDGNKIELWEAPDTPFPEQP